MNTVARVATVVTTAVVLFFASGTAAMADAPVTWDSGETNVMHFINVLVLFPLGLTVVLVLFALLTARNNYVPPTPSDEVEQQH